MTGPDHSLPAGKETGEENEEMNRGVLSELLGEEFKYLVSEATNISVRSSTTTTYEVVRFLQEKEVEIQYDPDLMEYSLEDGRSFNDLVCGY